MKCAEEFTKGRLWENTADLFLKMKRLDEALANAKTAVALDAKYDVAHVTKGEVLLELGRVEEACREFQTAIGLGFDKQRLAALMKDCD